MGKTEVRLYIATNLAESFGAELFFKENDIAYKGTNSICISDLTHHPDNLVDVWTMYMYVGNEKK